MAKKVRIPLGDGEVDVVELPYETSREEWNEYSLLDGGKVRVKTSVLKIFQVLDAAGNPANTPDGERYIVIRHRTDVTAS